jgi:hypothetical protein
MRHSDMTLSEWVREVLLARFKNKVGAEVHPLCTKTAFDIYWQKRKEN